MLVLLDKKTTKELEHTTTPTVNLMQYWKEAYDQKLHMEVGSWYYAQGFTADDPQKKTKARLSELLGSKPLYHANYEYREAVWGFNFNDRCSVVIYWSQKGLSIQVDNTKQAGEAVPDLYHYLHKLLFKGSVRATGFL